jgi:WhiB family redox-sensing transcriptional regulator
MSVRLTGSKFLVRPTSSRWLAQKDSHLTIGLSWLYRSAFSHLSRRHRLSPQLLFEIGRKDPEDYRPVSWDYLLDDVVLDLFLFFPSWPPNQSHERVDVDTSLLTHPQGVTMDWRDKAACLTVDPELFFPVGNTGPAVDQIDRAKAVCSHCPVTEYCLQYALDTNQDSGVWGGLSEDERRALKRRAARARRAS